MRLYLHLPFCLAKCPYCDFVSARAEEEVRAAYLEALLEELRMARPPGSCEIITVESIYCGGGTPSVYSPRELAGLLAQIKERWPVSPGAEVTVEINPATWSPDRLGEAVSAGFNRLSIGAQSFDDDVLVTLGRPHSADEARSLARLAGETQGASASLDLIYGVPGQNPRIFRDTLEEALTLRPRHISAYALTLDPLTPMGARACRGEIALPPEEEVAEMYGDACRILAAAGFVHYEISNFALPGWECDHNLAYWRREDYLGLGAAAHSLRGPDTRLRNVSDIAEYIRRVQAEESPLEEMERLNLQEIWEEEVMLSLRTAQGMEIGTLTRRETRAEGATRAWEDFVQAGLAWRRGARCGLTERGMFVSNHIISGLF
jgi:oxygen-independent coproporphyrinogen-3 oxidase